MILFSRARGGCRVIFGKAKPLGEASPWDRGRLARIRSAQQSAVASGVLLAFLILRAYQAGRMPALPAYRGPRHIAFPVSAEKDHNRTVSDESQQPLVTRADQLDRRRLPERGRPGFNPRSPDPSRGRVRRCIGNGSLRVIRRFLFSEFVRRRGRWFMPGRAPA